MRLTETLFLAPALRGGVADPYAHLRGDPVLARLIDRHGEIGLEPAADPFERLVVAVVNQQLSSASAAAIRERLFERFGVTPAALLAADEAGLREVGLSASKVEYVRNVAAAFRDGLSREQLEALDDEAVIDELTAITGVGVWTAKMFLIFVLAREDVFPIEDLGIRRGMEALYGLDDREAMVEHATDWAPYRSYASRYLWRAAD